MKPLRTRNDLLDLICARGLSRACITAIREDRAVVLGGFHDPSWKLPCYVVEVTSKHGKQWVFAVLIDDEKRQFALIPWTHDQIPWKYWQGQTGRKTYNLIDGDQPIRCAANKERANDPK